MAAVLVGAYISARQSLAAQVHDDSQVVTAWVVGVTSGSRHILPPATPMQRWLCAHGMAAAESPDSVQGRFQDNPGSLEVWFGYRSHLAGQPLLECHRVGPAAFADDRGQTYQGLLDFEGPYVGVYLPGYDHAARRLTAALHWLPRPPAPPTSPSRPMVFTLDLPALPRVLPPANSLPVQSAPIIRQSVQVTASRARMDRPRASGSRTLAFHLDIRGGRLWGSNVEEQGERKKGKGKRREAEKKTGKIGGNKEKRKGNEQGKGKTAMLRIGEKAKVIPAKVQRPKSPVHKRPSVIARRSSSLPASYTLRPAPFVIEDPYGVSLLSPDALITPMLSLEAAQGIRDSSGQVWTVPLLGAGSGTDAIRLRFTVLPNAPAGVQAVPISFEIILPVESGSEA